MPERTALPSQALLTAALGGLLCLSASACSSGNPASTDAGSNAEDSAAPRDSGRSHPRADAGHGGGDAGGADAVAGDAVVTDPDTPVPDTECDGGVSPDPMVTSSRVIPGGMTLAKFTKECNAMGGMLEIQPHCGGSNACRGMSYDSETETLIQHNCRATNSCGGFSCVVCK